MEDVNTHFLEGNEKKKERHDDNFKWEEKQRERGRRNKDEASERVKRENEKREMKR